MTALAHSLPGAIRTPAAARRLALPGLGVRFGFVPPVPSLRRMKLPSLVLGCLCVASLSAHECWLQPSTFTPAAGETSRLTLRIGLNFEGEVRPFRADRTAALLHFSAAGREDWTSRIDGRPELPLGFGQPGTHVVAYDSRASLITLPAREFDDYLREEGLESVRAERARLGEAAKPGRERYLRCNKTIVSVGGRRDATATQRTGQPLEIVPASDPTAGGAVRFVVWLGGQPLAGAKIRAWHRQGGELKTLDGLTAADGSVQYTLVTPGEWMLSTVHMARLTGDAEADWESHWGNLTFSVAAP